METQFWLGVPGLFHTARPRAIAAIKLVASRKEKIGVGTKERITGGNTPSESVDVEKGAARME